MKNKNRKIFHKKTHTAFDCHNPLQQIYPFKNISGFGQINRTERMHPPKCSIFDNNFNIKNTQLGIDYKELCVMPSAVYSLRSYKKRGLSKKTPYELSKTFNLNKPHTHRNFDKKIMNKVAINRFKTIENKEDVLQTKITLKNNVKRQNTLNDINSLYKKIDYSNSAIIQWANSIINRKLQVKE